MRCSRCKRENLIASDFYKNKNTPSGLTVHCKSCMNLSSKAYEERKPELVKARHKRWKIANREKVNAQSRIDRKRHRERNRSEYAKRCIKNRELFKIGRRICSKCLVEKGIEFFNKDTSRCKECLRVPPKKRKKRDLIKSKFMNCVSTNIRISLRCEVSGKSSKNGRHWEDLVGYTTKDLMEHLESLFTDGMSWNNQGKWHIDHIVPVSAFNFNSPEHIDFKRCWALSNLQPLWGRDNIRKHAKLDKEFQPSLKI